MGIQLTEYTQSYTYTSKQPSWRSDYNALFIDSASELSDVCILVLTGTSTQLEDIAFFIRQLVKTHFTIAAIERSVCGVRYLNLSPASDREATLKHFIHHLKTHYGIKKIVILTHSYASLEIIRLLAKNPASYKEHIDHIIFANPVGFGKKSSYISHCFRFLFIHILSEYILSIRLALNRESKSFNTNMRNKRKLKALNSFFKKTLQDPLRTTKEIWDIVSCDIREQVKLLMQEHGYSFSFILNKNDNLVSSSEVLVFLQQLDSSSNPILFSGNHLDCLTDERQVLTLINNIHKITARGSHA